MAFLHYLSKNFAPACEEFHPGFQWQHEGRDTSSKLWGVAVSSLGRCLKEELK